MFTPHPKLTHPRDFSYFSLGAVSMISLVAAIFTSVALSLHGGLFSDEHFHAPQIWQVYANTGVVDHKITVPLTYHYAIGFLLQKLGVYDDDILRLISLTVALSTIPLFYKMFTLHPSSNGDLRTLQMFFLPTGFIYYFLVYTDIWALASIGFCLYFALKNRYFLAAIAGLIALALRQDAILWVGLAFLLICSEGISQITRESFKIFVIRALTRGAIFIPIFIAFLAFLFINKGVALGDKEMHNAGMVNTTNLYIFLLLAWFVFLPLNLKTAPELFNWFKHLPLLKTATLLAIFVIYLTDIGNAHPYNQTHLSYFLHNGLAHHLSHNMILKSLAFIPMMWMALTLLTMPLQQARYKWMLLIIPAALVLHPLIDPRYYLPAFMAIQLIRPSAPRGAEMAMLYVLISITALVMFGTLHNKFFL